MLYFDKQFEQGLSGVNHRGQYKHITQVRNAARMMDRQLAAITGNAAAVIPLDVYREFDSQAKMLMRAPNLSLMQDLMPLAKALPVGKIEHIYRRASDSGVVTSSISGQTPVELDKAAYDYDSSIKVIHQTGFGREWMEMEGQRSEGFDGLIDDQANSTRAIVDKISDHFYNGANVSFKGIEAYGIKNSTKVQDVELDAGGLNIDFSSASATAEDIRAGWIAMDDELAIKNNVMGERTYYVSREIFSNFKRFYSTTGDNTTTTILDALRSLPGIRDIKEDASLSGNEVVGGVLDSQFIRPLVGMAVTTVPVNRTQYFDNYNFITWANVGLEVKTDYTGKTGWLYARAIT